MSKITLELKDEILSKCENEVEATEFDSINEYLSFIIEQVVCCRGEKHLSDQNKLNNDYVDQLESLGYL